MSHTDIDQLLQKHARFWAPGPGIGPLLAELPHPDWRPKPYPLAGGRYVSDISRITPEEIDVQRLLALDERLPALTIGDKINCINAAYPVAWMEAVLGCPIYASAFSCSSKPVIEGRDGRVLVPDVRALRESPWLRVMDEVLEAEVAAAGAAYPAGQLHLRGVIDMLAAYLGEERLCLMIHDAPQDLLQLADTFSDLYLEIARRGLRLRPPWRGGYVSCWGVHAAGPLLDYQIDASNLVSPETYKTYFASFDEKVLSEFQYTVIHLHSCALHIVPAVVDMEGVRAVQISLDGDSSSWDQERVLDACQRIQSRSKSLIIMGELAEHELGEFLRRLNPGGLAIFYFKPKAS